MAERPNAPAPISENIPENIESFSENIIPHQSVEPETTTLRSRTMTEKGLEYAKELKAKTAKAATDHFRQVISDFLAHLSSSNNKDQILKELSHCNALAESATTKLNDFYDLIKETPDSQEVADSQLDIHQSINEAKKIAHEKITTLEYQADKMSVISSASHSSRRSSKSSKSARDTLIDVRAKRAALEEKIKFNNSILEQEQKLANLKLQQELNATKAEEAVYKEAISLEEFELPIEKENLISRFLSEAQTTKPVITDPIQSCLSPFNFPNTESSLVYTKPQRPLTANTFVTFQTTQVPENRPFISQSQTNPPSTLTAWHNAQEFTPKSSTVYQEIQNAQPMSHNQNVQSSDPSRHYNGIPNQSVTQSYQQPLQTDSVKQIAEALAKVTQLQRLPQAKPDIFTGEGPHTKFFIWETAFDALIDTAPVSAQQKLYLLYQHLGGKAKVVVEQLQYMVGADPDTAYREARNKLRNRFGRPDIIATEFETKLTNWPKIAPNDGKGLREFSDFLYQVQVASAHMSALKIYEFPSKIQSLVEKLPGWFATKWSIKVQALQQERGYSAFPSFSDLVTEVCFHAERMNIPQLTPTKHSSTPTPIQTHRKPQERIHNVLLTKTEAQKKEALVKHTEKKVCPYHNNAASHNLTECKRFKELLYEERLEFLKSNGLCFKCTGKHFRKDCEETPPRCEACNKNHLTLLHEDRSAPAKPAPPSPPEASATCTQVCGGEGTGRSCARIVLVNLTHESQPHKKQLTYAVLDDQSTDVFITDSLSRLLGITAPELDLKVNTIIGFNTIRTKKITGLRIQDIKNEHAHVRIPYAYTREYIPAAQSDIASPEVAKQWTHLAPIVDQIAYRPDIEIGLLIGRNVPAAFQPTEVIAGSPEEPWAEKYKFGWTVIGRVCKDRDDDVTARVNCVTVEREVLLEHNASSHTTVQPPFVRTTPSKDMTSPQQIRQMMELDYTELHHDRSKQRQGKTESREDIQFNNIMEIGLHKNENGNWEAPLPFRANEVHLPDNKKHCLHRLLSLKRKLLGNDKLRNDYIAFMKKVIDRGHASRVPVDQLRTSPGKVWFLPHFNVQHPRKKDLRVVFDCSSVYENESLNKNLLQGPDQLNSLIGVLMRFRKEEVAFTCDIEQMFHSFYVNPEHRDFLRFLWFEDSDLTKPIVEFRMDVHLFGAASSPAVANYCLHQTAETGREKHGDDAAEFVRRNFYVDDGLKSLPTTEQAVRTIKATQAMCADANLRLHKFASNSKEVLEALHPEDRAKDLKDLDLNHDSLPVQRSLGTYWCIESDTLGFRIELRDKPLTRRGILSTVSSVYDPLGAVSPVILTGKQILQELCSTHTDWDEPLPEDIRPRWEKWRTELPLLENLKFPRCLKPPNFGTLTSTQVCNFSDACHNGIGQVSYLRMVNEKGEVHVSFLMAKSRVAPLKQITIPRLELTAAVISVNVSSMVELELDLQPTPQRLYYTDSEIVLGYLNNDARRFHVYVGNRVQHIRDQSEPEQWYHVPGKENPADEASRGMTAAQLIENKRWFSGPQFLYENPTPSNQKPSSQLDPDDAELRKEASVLSTSTTMRTQYLDTKHFSHSSSLLRLKHAIVRIQRMIERLRPNKTHNWRPTNGASTVKELWEAEKCLFKTAQATTFENEIDTLQRMKGNNSKFEDRKSARDRNNIIKATSNIYKLDPFIDDEGLLRVGGRLRNAEEEYQLKHPLILPKDHHVTTAKDGQHKCFERPVHKLIMLLARED
ncbi:uncharacterized protein LOC116614782 isoform X1 [Nematostella vectensis]|uniref:uncharacterized protein LOC116614782 isoform X1 n=1 Tax=Nematostella vectensis TaxID=45351 RepID=UPI0020770D44|nr:uncharacterized protein LOC116614782 isoform X1 [Nematostella vectensis]